MTPPTGASPGCEERQDMHMDSVASAQLLVHLGLVGLEDRDKVRHGFHPFKRS